ncbi:MAG TPA: PH domain-containing protein [Reyranella sp.]
MAYVNSVLQPGENLKVIGRLHWINYFWAFVLLVIAVALLLYGTQDTTKVQRTVTYIGWLVLAVAVVMLLSSWFARQMTELSVTDHRVIYKTGFLRRHTVEMNMDKVETVNVDQSILGRILGYGSIHVLGTGQGIEGLRRIARPIAVRNAITAR